MYNHFWADVTWYWGLYMQRELYFAKCLIKTWEYTPNTPKDSIRCTMLCYTTLGFTTSSHTIPHYTILPLTSPLWPLHRFLLPPCLPCRPQTAFLCSDVPSASFEIPVMHTWGKHHSNWKWKGHCMMYLWVHLCVRKRHVSLWVRSEGYFCVWYQKYSHPPKKTAKYLTDAIPKQWMRSPSATVSNQGTYFKALKSLWSKMLECLTM